MCPLRPGLLKNISLLYGVSQFNVSLLKLWLGGKQFIGQEYVLTLALLKGLVSITLL
jgi:hypothetical protein